MVSDFYTILTAIGKSKLANAQATGTTVNLTELAVGDSNGAYYNPSEDQTALVNEVWRGSINQIYVDSQNSNWVVIEAVIPTDQGGFYIREVGVFDDAGDLIAIGKYPETYKPALDSGSGKDLYIRMILEISNVSDVTLKIDPAIVLATRKYVDDELNDHNNDPNAHDGLINADTVDNYHASQTPTANTIPVADASSTIDAAWYKGSIDAAMQRTFYVDAANGDDNNDGSESAPFATIEKACKSVPTGGGATIYLLDGSYTITSDIFLFNKLITIRCDKATNSVNISFTTYTYESSQEKERPYGFELTNSQLLFYGYGKCSIETPQLSLGLPIYDEAVFDIRGNSLIGFWDCNISVNDFYLVSGYSSVGTLNAVHACFSNNTIIKNASKNVLKASKVLIHSSSNDTIQDSAENTLTWSNVIDGIVKDAIGVPRNVLSNIDLTGTGEASFSESGYQKLPNGLIIQWFKSSPPSDAPYDVTLPIAFPNGILSAAAVKAEGNYNLVMATLDSANSTLSTLRIGHQWTNRNEWIAGHPHKWIVIGY